MIDETTINRANELVDGWNGIDDVIVDPGNARRLMANINTIVGYERFTIGQDGHNALAMLHAFASRFVTPLECCEDGGNVIDDTENAKRSGTKYDRVIHPKYADRGVKPITVDVYDVLAAFGVTSQPRGHAIKKLLCGGLRSKGSELQDLREAIDAIQRDIEMIERREAVT